MFTSWEQVEAWIRDNNFAHWVFYRTNPAETESKQNNIIADSNYYTGGDEDKLAMTKKYLLLHGGRAWGVGFKTPNTTVGGAVCDVRIEDEQPQKTSGIGGEYQNIGQLREEITRSVRAEIEAADMKRRLAEIERREKELDEERQSAIGALVHYFAPIGQMIMERKVMPRVAGIDAEQPVRAQRIVAEPKHEPQEPEQPQEQEETQEPFTDEEAERLMALMVRFKAVEPRYLELIESVVTMAENGDSTYNMAKGFLLK